MTNFTIPNNISSVKFALKSVPGLADAGVPHGDGDGPRTPPRCMEGVWKKFPRTDFIMPSNICSIKCALKSVPGLADAGVLHGVGDGPVTLALGSGSKKRACHADQHEKLKGFDV